MSCILGDYGPSTTDDGRHWNGLLGLLANASIDAIIEPYSYRAERLRDFRYSTTCDYYEESFFIADKTNSNRLTTNFIVYPINVLVLIIVSVVVISIVEAIANVIRTRYIYLSTSLIQNDGNLYECDR
jgi:hypothetical protein